MKKRTLMILAMVLAVMLILNTGLGFAQAKKSTKSVYVISSITVKTSYGGSSANTEKIKFKYNKNGLIRSYKGKDFTEGTFKYSGKKLKSAEVTKGDGVPSKFEYTWKDGKLVSSYDSNNQNTTEYTYNKKGKITKISRLANYSSSPTVISYKYNSKKRLTKELIGNSTVKYTYNKKGILTKFDQYGTVYKFSNTVRNGRVTKIVKRMPALSSYKTTVTVKYKKISVPSSYTSLIKTQRNQILMDLGYGTSVYNLPLGTL